MTLFCDLDDSARCSRCGRVAYSREVRRECGPGLGDLIASGLERVGITKQWISSMVGEECGCESRQRWLNAASAAAHRYVFEAARIAAQFCRAG